MLLLTDYDNGRNCPRSTDTASVSATNAMFPRSQPTDVTISCWIRRTGDESRILWSTRRIRYNVLVVTPRYWISTARRFNVSWATQNSIFTATDNYVLGSLCQRVTCIKSISCTHIRILFPFLMLGMFYCEPEMLTNLDSYGKRN